MDQSPKLFVLIDKRLSRSQQAVQACHAVAEFALKYGNQWEHRSMVLLAVDGGDQLEEWTGKLADCRFVEFREPYYDNRMTAIACHGCDELIKELRLL